MRVLRVLGVGQLCIMLICSLIACYEECNENPDIEEYYITPDPPVYIGQERSLQVKVTDPDGDEVHCAWEASDTRNVNVTAQVFKHGASGASIKFKADIPDTYMITVTAADLNGGHDAKSFLIHVLEEIPPGVVNITKPANGAEVDWETEVKGTCKGIPQGQRIWVYVRPHTVGLWYPQKPPAVKADGTWSVLCCFGLEGKDQGAEFDVGVILVDEDRARDITEKLQEGDAGPEGLTADPILAMITVKRR